MFEQAFLEKQKRRTWSMGASLMLEVLVVGILILIPLANTEAIQRSYRVILEPPAGPPPDGPKQAQQRQPSKAAPAKFDLRVFVAPSTIPPVIDLTPDQVTEAAPSEFSIGLSDAAVVIGGTGTGRAIRDVLGGTGRSAAPAPAAPRQPPPPAKLIRIAHMDPATIISRPQPAYPQIARAARIQGVVRLAAVINEQGAIEDLRVIDGPVLLVNAAVEAVREWRYRPLIMNGVPTKIETNIEVRFSLTQ